MADTTDKKTYLINVQDNLDIYAQNVVDADKAVQKFASDNVKLLLSQDKNNAEYVKAEAKLKILQAELKNSKKNVELATKANVANKGSYEELYRKWQLAQTQLKLMGKSYETNSKGVRVLSQEYQKQSKIVAESKASLDQFGKGVHDNRLNVGSYGEAIQAAFGGMNPLMTAAAGGVKKVSMAFKALLANPIVAVIAAVVAAFSTLIAYFKRSEEGQNALAKVTMVFKSVLDNILDVVSAVGKAIWTAFTKPKEAIEKLGNFIKTNITNRIEALKDIGGAVMKIFKGDFKQGFKELGESSVQLLTGVDDLVGKVGRGVKKLGEEIADDVRRAKILADELAQIAKDERRELVDNAKLAGESAKLRADAELEKFLNAQKAIELYEKSFDLDEKVLARELDLAKRKAKNAAEQAALANSDIEKINAVAAAEAEVFKKQQAFDEKRRERTRRLNMIRKEALKQEEDAAKARIEIYKAEVAGTVKKNTSIIASELATVEEKVAAAEENLRIQKEVYSREADVLIKALDVERELKLKSEENYAIELAALIANRNADIEMMEVAHQDNLDKIAKQAAKEAADDFKALIEIERIQNQYSLDEQARILDLEYQGMLKAVEYEQLTANQKLLIEEKYNEAKRQLSLSRMALSDQELNMQADALGAMSNLIGQQTAAGKGFAVAQAMINTYVAASQALRDPTLVSTAMKVAAMISIIGTGLANVRNILKVDTSGSASGAATSISSSPAVQHITAPSVGVSSLAPSAAPSAISAATGMSGLTPEAIAAALSGLPAPIVTVEDINARTADKRKVEVKATI